MGSGNVGFHPGVYQESPPDVKGRNVIIVDFSYKRDVLIEMSEQADTLTIIDHHKTAQDDLVNLPRNVFVHFDMAKSGAVLVWEYFHPGKEVPQLLLHIQDRDLWKFELPGTREIQACLFSYPYDFALWERWLVDGDMDSMRQDGVAIDRKHFKDIREFIDAAQYRMILDGHNVPVLNCPYIWSSDAGHIMCEGESFAVCYWDTPKGRTFSLRSDKDGLDVSEIAKKYGGGGHQHAAGFTLFPEDVWIQESGTLEARYCI